MRALDALLAAQFPSGGFPQVWTGPVLKQPIVQANFPEHDYHTEGRIINYWDMPTLNDNVCVHVTHALRDAYQTYKDTKYLDALKKLGDFLLLAQMPEPQPAWAQQYNYQMQPIWARRFEPPAIAGHESQGVQTCSHLTSLAPKNFSRNLFRSSFFANYRCLLCPTHHFSRK